MKAFLLSAGLGTRLGNLTKDTPKCLLSVGSKNMLEHWYSILAQNGITEVLINTHFCPEKVISCCGNLITSTGIRTTFFHEPKLLGTAKTIYANQPYVKDERHFVIIYADTWMQVDLRQMLKFQKKRKGMGTLGLYKPANMKDQGCVTVEKRKITNIAEKPESPKGNYAFAGVMIASNFMFKFYDNSMTDLAKDWLPKIQDGLNPFFIDSFVCDIGTPERYKFACDTVKGMGFKAL